jgi:hypothetical protein
MVETAEAPLFAGADFPVPVGWTPTRAEGVAAVEALALSDPEGRERRIACDAIVLGVGAIPCIDLLAAAGCRTVFDGARGGFIPELDGAGRTSIAAIQAVGDCAGVWAEKTEDRRIAEEEGVRAVRLEAHARPVAAPDLAAYRMDWVRRVVLGADGPAAPHVCRCEEVTAREILEVRPPRYLGAQRETRNDRSLASLLGRGPPSPDQVKRLTRAGMGVCQGRRCREQVAALLALSAGVELGEIQLASYRAPVRPLPLSAWAATPEPAAMSAHWSAWFGIATQARPYWEIETEDNNG